VTDAAKPDFEQNLVDFGSARFTQLRPGQRQVLAAYADQHPDTADLAIEMPTGEGKTLLALLIADHALSRGWSVAYLTGTRQLAERVEKEAEDLGLDVVRFAAKDYGGAKLDDYHQPLGTQLGAARETPPDRTVGDHPAGRQRRVRDSNPQWTVVRPLRSRVRLPIPPPRHELP
jgi:Rad3-related DNA helicase